MEELAMFLLSILAFSQLSFVWWWFIVLLLLPDLSMIGYILGNRVGAVMYNFFHHKAFAIAVYTLGLYLSSEAVQLGGVILFGHSSMDRMLGYGLKMYQGFKFTHLGKIGK